MINRIRDVRKQKGMTLAEVAAACSPPTTAQTIGRLETGLRTLSLVWMNRLAAALDGEPELLVKGEAARQTQVVARLTEAGADALASPRDAILPVELGGAGPQGAPLLCLAVDAPQGEYRAGDHPRVDRSAHVRDQGEARPVHRHAAFDASHRRPRQRRVSPHRHRRHADGVDHRHVPIAACGKRLELPRDERAEPRLLRVRE